ncbi:MAG TPA: response regulator [Pyrinomonadaceae bacterium]|nr:response regulator [Pyrinomonadaceae bacterium]
MAKKVLIVEDYADVRTMMSTYLTIQGYEVVEAPDGYKAVEAALEQKPDVILMDISMPVMDGIYSTKAIRDHADFVNIPIIALTAFGDFYHDRARNAGCNDVLQKPIDFGELEQVMHQYLH